jgi:DNA polymerase V
VQDYTRPFNRDEIMHPITLTFLTPSVGQPLLLPLLSFQVAAGFPSPAGDYIEERIDLNEHFIRHPAATFFVRVAGDSMNGAGINCGDVLIVDRAAEVQNGCIVVARINDEFTLKRIRKKGSQVFLVPENEQFQAIEVIEGSDFEVWGRVVGSVRKY